MSTHVCGEHAAFRFTWPGREEAFTCVEHAGQLRGVAMAMGFPLQLIPLAYRAGDSMPSEFPTCKQQVSDSVSGVGSGQK